MFKLKPSFGNFFFLLLLLFLSNTSQAQQDKGFIWEVSGVSGKVHLLGSLHFANANFYPLRKEIQQAFLKSNNLVVEVDVNKIDPQTVQRLLIEKGTYSSFDTLENHVSAKTYQRILQYFQQRNIPPTLFDKYKPGMLVMALTSMELEKMGMSPDFGIDLYFTEQARGKKQILELETLNDQLDLLLNLDDSDQLLMQTLDEFKDYPKLTRTLIKAWKTGDTKLLKRLLIDKPLQEYPESKSTFDKMITRRNYQMVAKITDYLKTGDSYFIVVGAGHMVGKQGIIDLLEQNGFQVNQL